MSKTAKGFWLLVLGLSFYAGRTWIAPAFSASALGALFGGLSWLFAFSNIWLGMSLRKVDDQAPKDLDLGRKKRWDRSMETMRSWIIQQYVLSYGCLALCYLSSWALRSDIAREYSNTLVGVCTATTILGLAFGFIAVTEFMALGRRHRETQQALEKMKRKREALERLCENNEVP